MDDSVYIDIMTVDKPYNMNTALIRFSTRLNLQLKSGGWGGGGLLGMNEIGMDKSLQQVERVFIYSG